MNKELKARLEKIDEIREQLQKAEKSAAKDIMSMLKELMSSNPLLVGLRWNQYTPSFNDGEPCEFTTDGPYFKFDDSLMTQESKKSRDEDEYDEAEGGDGYLSDYQVEELFEKKTDILNHKEMIKLKKAVKEASVVYNKLTDMEAQLESMFETNMQITVTADGVESEDYDCGY